MSNPFFQIDPKLEQLAARAESDCAAPFSRISEMENHNTAKVLSAFIGEGVSESHFAPTTGYGYDDRGRETLDRVFARIFGCEDALVRFNFVSGTHALTTALFGVLRPGDRLLSVTGKPYDTLEEVIGLRGKGNGSLKDFGVEYGQIDLLEDGSIDLDAVEQAASGAKVIYLQRSRGYSLRPTLSVEAIGQAAQRAHRANPSCIVMVDNCYGEFVERFEPTQQGADLAVGSLIKNPGGGLAPTGGYIAGRKELVEQAAYRLTSPGMGKEVGCTLGQNKSLFMGLFFAPSVVTSAVRTAVFASRLFQLLGFPVYPAYDEPRSDIIQAVELGDPQRLVAFCQGMQKGAPVDAFVSPEPWDMPGYDSQVIMAAGAFTMGASIELSADAPMREPYAAWMQGGLTYPSAKIGVLLAAQSMLEQGLLP